MARSAELSELWKYKSNNSNNFYICNVCRLCANICDNVVPIFDKVNEKGSIYDKLKKCLPSISVRESDIKPKQVCVACVSKLELCVSFIEMSLDTDYKFDAMLQTRILPQMQINNDRLAQSMPHSSDLSWLQIKTEPEWNDVQPNELINRPNEQKLADQSMSGVTSALVSQAKSNQTIQQPSSLANFKIENDNYGALVNKQDTNHNLLQNLLMPEGMSAQDLIVLVEVKNEKNSQANNLILSNGKKHELSGVSVPGSCDKIAPTDDILPLSSRLIDSAVNNLDLGSLSDFDEATSLLKAFENDLMNALKTEALNQNDVPAFDYVPPKEQLKTDKDLIPKSTVDASCNTSIVTSADSMKKSPPARDFTCGICGRGFTRRNRLNAHIARHSSERPHSCDKCDQRFITRWDLTLHLRIHSGIFKCEYCGKAFPAKGKLERHRRTHTGERPFPCTLCAKAFSEKRNLENHLKTHAAASARNCASHVTIPRALPSVYLSCGHINSAASYSLRKTCDTCQKSTAVSAVGGSTATIVSPNVPTAVASQLKGQVVPPTIDSLNNNSCASSSSSSSCGNGSRISDNKVPSSSVGR
ncbi:hypothetical protein V9T40_007695 [Parthenolecanium corni]|uniref:Uncharacterized protein n=1 Tax=Parthenolecanium corni TaxID=536013 RepID=A0AAN9Y634_9HEMI